MQMAGTERVGTYRVRERRSRRTTARLREAWYKKVHLRGVGSESIQVDRTSEHVSDIRTLMSR